MNTDSNGLRLVRDQGPWPPTPAARNVFVFGGSTTFGFGVADFETIPSLLQEQLNSRLGGGVKVYNLGVGGYYSSQERVRFERHLANGIIPETVVFIDGLNEFVFERDEPGQTRFLAAAMRGDYFFGEVRARFKQIAVVDLAHSIQRKFAGSAPAPPPPDTAEQANKFRAICERYLRTQRLELAAAEAFGVKSCFVWQPIPVYQYDLKHFLFDPQWTGADHKAGYEVMAAILKTNSPPRNFLWLADMQASLKEGLYVDQVHYNPYMNGLIAAKIADYLISSGALSPK